MGKALLTIIASFITLSFAKYTLVDQILRETPSNQLQPGGRDLWTCDALECTTCINTTDRMYCALNNQMGTCCTKTDGRPPCTNAMRNCSTATNFNTTNNFAYLICAFNETYCGTNTAPVDINDSENDPRFGKNFIIARGDVITIQTPPGSFTRNKRCTWVIKKTFNKTGLAFWITTNAAVNFTLFRGGRNFVDLTNAAEVRVSNSGTQKYEWSSFPDNEYLWVQMSSRADEAFAEF